MHWLFWLYFLLLLVTDVCGLVLAAFTLPGLWLMLAGAGIYAWLTHGEFVGYKTLIVLLILAVGAEIAEIFVSGAGAKKAGASRWGMFGGLVGGIIGGIFLTGLIPIPILGTVIGICLGSFIGAFGIEMVVGKPLTQSAAIGYGAARGRFTGILYKIGIGIAMFLITLCMAPPFHFSKSKAVPAGPAPAVTKPFAPSTTRIAIRKTPVLKTMNPRVSRRNTEEELQPKTKSISSVALCESLWFNSWAAGDARAAQCRGTGVFLWREA